METNKGNKGKVQVPRLQGRENFREWEQAMFLALKRLQVKLRMDVQRPRYIDPPTARPTNLELKQKLTAKEVEGLTYSEFDAEEDNHMTLVEGCAFIQVQVDSVTQYTACRTQYAALRRKYVDEATYIMSIFHGTLDSADRQSISSTDTTTASPYKAFQTLKSKYKVEDSTERKRYRNLLLNLKFDNLHNYVVKYEEYTSRYQELGGLLHDGDEVVRFLHGLPENIYRAEKRNNAEESLKKCLEYFRTLATRENILDVPTEVEVIDRISQQPQRGGRPQRPQRSNYNNSVPTHNHATAPNKHTTSGSHHLHGSKKLQRKIRCNKCTGWGHRARECPTHAPVCGICGDDGHMQATCPSAQVLHQLLFSRGGDEEDIDSDDEEVDTTAQVRFEDPDVFENEANYFNLHQIWLNKNITEDIFDLEVAAFLNHSTREVLVRTEAEVIFHEEAQILSQIEITCTDIVPYVSPARPMLFAPQEHITATTVRFTSAYNINSLVINKLEAKTCWCNLGTKCLRLIFDSGASKHVAEPAVLQQLQPIRPKISLRSAFGEVEDIVEAGMIPVVANGGIMKISNVLSCAKVTGNVILSIERLLVEFDCSIEFAKSGAILISSTGDTILSAPFDRAIGNYVVHTSVPEPDSILPVHTFGVSIGKRMSKGELWHYIMGHASRSYLKRAGLPAPPAKFWCETCAATKLPAHPVGGPLDEDTTRQYIPSYPMEKLYDGGEFESEDLKLWFDERGIIHEPRSAHKPSEAGRIERQNRVIKEGMRANLHGAGLLGDRRFWALAAQYTAQVWNTLSPPPSAISAPPTAPTISPAQDSALIPAPTPAPAVSTHDDISTASHSDGLTSQDHLPPSARTAPPPPNTLCEINPYNVLPNSVSRRHKVINLANYEQKLYLASTVSPPKCFQDIAKRLDAHQWLFAYHKEVDSLELVGVIRYVYAELEI